MTIEQIVALIEGDLSTLASKLGVLGSDFVSSINTATMAQIAEAAFQTGGASAVIPALIANVSEWVSNPYEAYAVAIALRFAAEYLSSLFAAAPAHALGHPAAMAGCGNPTLAFSNVKGVAA